MVKKRNLKHEHEIGRSMLQELESSKSKNRKILRNTKTKSQVEKISKAKKSAQKLALKSA